LNKSEFIKNIIIDTERKIAEIDIIISKNPKSSQNDHEEKKKDLQLLLSTINNKSLKEIIARSDINTIFYKSSQVDSEAYFDDVRANDYFALIKYLIRNGYIDETYHDYMTYFYPNSITKEDKILLRSITDKKAKDYNYKLKNVETILTRLKPYDYTQEEILNFDLLSYLIKNMSKYDLFVKSIFDQLAHNKNIDFCIKFIDTYEEIPSELKCIVDFWPDFLELALNFPSINKSQCNKLVSYVILNFDDKYIDKQKKVLKDSQWTDENLSQKIIPDDKILILITAGILSMTEANLLIMRNDYHDHLLTFQRYNKKEYIKLINANNVVLEELDNLLEIETSNDENEIDFDFDLPDDVLMLVLKSGEINHCKQKKLFAMNIKELKKIPIIECLKLIDEKVLLELLQNKNQKILKNETNGRILGAMKNIGLIEDIKFDKDDKYYKVYGKQYKVDHH
jgi:hypothetical protein